MATVKIVERKDHKPYVDFRCAVENDGKTLFTKHKLTSTVVESLEKSGNLEQYIFDHALSYYHLKTAA